MSEDKKIASQPDKSAYQPCGFIEGDKVCIMNYGHSPEHMPAGESPSVGPAEQVRCPTCGNIVGSEYCIHAPVESTPSPAQEPAGAREQAKEWTFRNRGHQFVDEYCSAEVYDLMVEYAASQSAKYEKALDTIVGMHDKISELRNEVAKQSQKIERAEAAEHSLSEVTTKLDRIEKALRNVIDSAVTDADTCSICLRDVSKHSDGCAIQLAESALSGEES